MAKQTINQGTAPTGAGGDTFRTGSAKLQANDDEIYNQLGANAQGVLPAALPVNKGGTGASTAAQARTNLGLGTAAMAALTTSNTDLVAGRVLKVGDLGLGNLLVLKNSTAMPTPDDLNNIHVGFFAITTNILNSPGAGWVESRNWSGGSSQLIKQIWTAAYSSELRIRQKTTVGGDFSEWARFYSTANTTVDANGFIKAASPIVELYADRIELNAEAQQQDITFEKLGVGDYLIKGSSGFAQEGWYVEQPKDANGNIFHAVVYEQLENGDISVKTYEKRITETGLIAADPNKPIDIKENRFISIRLQELPAEEIEPEVDQTILDDEGQPAPSKYHTLENGVWVILGEDAERLEQEQLAKMQPLTRRQFRLALAMNGYDLSQVEALIDQIPDPMQRQIALIEWQDATTFERLNTSLLAMANLMGLSTEQVNMLWNQALTL